MTNTAPHVLIVDDDREIHDLTTRFLRGHGIRASIAASGKEMDAVLTGGRFDLVVLDLMLPGEDGLSICRRLRAQGALPIIMLTARGAGADRPVGLELGADDCLAKPFNPRELVARIKAVLRRSQATATNAADTPPGRALTFAGWTLSLTSRELHVTASTLVTLTSGGSSCWQPWRRARTGY